MIFKLVLDMYDGAGDEVQAGQVKIGGHLGEEIALGDAFLVTATLREPHNLRWKLDRAGSVVP